MVQWTAAGYFAFYWNLSSALLAKHPVYLPSQSHISASVKLLQVLPLSVLSTACLDHYSVGNWGPAISESRKAHSISLLWHRLSRKGKWMQSCWTGRQTIETVQWCKTGKTSSPGTLRARQWLQTLCPCRRATEAGVNGVCVLTDSDIIATARWRMPINRAIG